MVSRSRRSTEDLRLQGATSPALIPLLAGDGTLDMSGIYQHLTSIRSSPRRDLRTRNPALETTWISSCRYQHWFPIAQSHVHTFTIHKTYLFKGHLANKIRHRHPLKPTNISFSWKEVKDPNDAAAPSARSTLATCPRRSTRQGTTERYDFAGGGITI